LFTTSDSPVNDSNFHYCLLLFSYKAQEPNSTGVMLRIKHQGMQTPS